MSEAYRSPISPGLSWYEDSVGARPRYPRLDGSTEVDVVVVGGGFTGLSAGLHLARAGLSVAVLEAHRFGDGASGRNGGQMGTGHRLWVDELEADFGFERTRALFDLAEDAKAHLLNLMETNGIDAEYRPGQLSVAHRKRFEADYRAHVESMATRYGYPHLTFMDGPETEERIGSKAYLFGIRDTGTGHVHPMKLLVGTARAAREAGAQLFEETPVTSLEASGGRVEAKTPFGTVRAGRALLATNAHGGALNERAAAHMLPIQSFIGATEPLAEPDRVLAGNEAMDDSRFVVRYVRKSPDGRLLFGGREAYGGGGRAIEPQIRRQIEDTWPHLKGVGMSHAWGGSVAVTRTRMPYAATVAPGITALGGWSGHGVMLSHFCGRLYAEHVAGGPDRLSLLRELQLPAFPGGRRLRAPLLFLAMTWFSLRDRV